MIKKKHTREERMSMAYKVMVRIKVMTLPLGFGAMAWAVATATLPHYAVLIGILGAIIGAWMAIEILTKIGDL